MDWENGNLQRLDWENGGRRALKQSVRKTHVQVRLEMLQRSFLVTRTPGKKKVLFVCEGGVDLSRKLKLLQHVSGHLQSPLLPEL